jgi:ribonuclease HII
MALTGLGLKKYYMMDDTLEIGIDEAGRGPMFGRVYIAAAVLPKDDSFDHDMVKDSKRFHSATRIMDACEYVKQHALYYSVQYRDAEYVDTHNIRESVLSGMKSCVKDIHDRAPGTPRLLVDGNDFRPYTYFDGSMIKSIPHVCIEGGDNKYTAIAAASILAKVERDAWVLSECEKDPTLSEYYSIDKNKGYGTRQHMDGIKMYGISSLHRKSYGICKRYAQFPHHVTVTPVISDKDTTLMSL